MSGTIISLGEKFPLFSNNLDSMKDRDGSIFESLGEDDGYFLTILLRKPSPEEINLFHKKARFRLFEEEDHILPLIRFGSDNFIFEMDFDPTLYADTRALQLKDTNNIISIALVDSSDFTVKGLREGNLPLKLIKRCSEVWENNLKTPNYSERHKEWYQDLQRRLDLNTVWNRSTDAGLIGESFDLNELKI